MKLVHSIILIKKNIFEHYDFIGLFQYDMEVSSDCFIEIENTFHKNPNTMFIVGFFRWHFFGGQAAIVFDFPYFKSGLSTYNSFFNTSFTVPQLLQNHMPSNNTFVINKNMFKKMMSWLEMYYINNIPTLMVDDDFTFNPGHMIEGLISMFLSFEVLQGAEFKFSKNNHNEFFFKVLNIFLIMPMF